MSSPPSKSREWFALALLIPLFVTFAWAMSSGPWRSPPSVDGRTYIEMIKGISDNGLPYLANGPSEEFPELRARWNVEKDHRLWGSYPPVYAYLAVPFFRWGGLAGVSRFNGALLIVFIFGAFAIGRKYMVDPLMGTATAYLAFFSPASLSMLDIGPYMLMIGLVAWATYFALAALDTEERVGRSAFLVGILGGLAIGSHLLSFPMIGALVGVLFLPATGWLPNRASLERAGWVAAGLVTSILPTAILNQLRFGSLNPISYGPCPWRSCAETGQDQQHLHVMLGYAGPTFLWFGLTIVAIRLARTRLLRAGAIAAAAVVFVAIPPLRSHGLRIAQVLTGYVADMNLSDMFPLAHPPDGVGYMFGPYLVKSSLQVMPALVLAAYAPFSTERERRLTRALALPCVALLLAITLRANQPGAFAYGFPFVNLRYVTPALALFAAMSLAAIRNLPWQRRHAGLLAGAFVLGTAWLGQWTDDGPLARRIALLYGSLVISVVVAGCVFAVRRQWRPLVTWGELAAGTSALAIGWGLATWLAVDFPALRQMHRACEERLDLLATVLPYRSAVIGGPYEIDPPLALRASRDIEYADLYETTDLADVPALVDHWSAEKRPVYFLAPAGRPPVERWAGFRVELIDRDGEIYLVHKD